MEIQDLAESRYSSVCLLNEERMSQGPCPNGSVGEIMRASNTLCRLRGFYFNGAVRLSVNIGGHDQFGRVKQSAAGKQATPKEKSKFDF